MAGQAGTLETVARQLGLALQPLEDRLASGNVIALFAELGLQFPPQLLQPAFVSALNTASTAAGQLPATIAQLAAAIDGDDETGILADGLRLVDEIGALIGALAQIGSELQGLAGSLPGMNAADVNNFAQDLASKLVGYMVVSYLENVQRGVVGIANLLGIIDYIPNPGVAGDPTHPPYTLRQLQLSRFGDLFTKPDQLLKTLYQWGDPAFDGTKLIPRLATSLNLLGTPALVKDGPPIAVDSPFLTAQFNSATNPPGLAATVKAGLTGGFDLTFPFAGVWSVHLLVQGDFVGGLQSTIVPPANITLHPAATLNGQLEADLIAQSPDAAHPIVILGQTGGSRLQTDSFTLGMGVTITWDSSAGTASVEPLVKVGIKGGKLVIDTTHADGFLATVLSGVHVEAGFDLGVTWAPDAGIRITGGSQLEIDLPINLTLGPITVPTLYLVGGVDSSGIPLELSVALGVSLGPLQASVDRMGAKALISFPSQGGNLGPANFSIAFKPPNGIGLSVNAGVVQGGGYLYIDTDRGEYAGALQLEIAGFLSVAAIGLISTKMPDGTPGFSLLIILTADFGPGIQLSFGFTLLAVGGLLGLNRTILFQPLMDGIRTNAIQSIMFPQDVVANAPRIISDLRAIFPPQQGTFLIGPMAKLGWGEPTLISLSLGVIIEIPPGDAAILGILRTALPADDVAILVLQVNFAGVLEFDKQRFYFYAALFDSHVLFITISGSMGVLFAYGDNANFVLSVGGFHPQFNPPPLPFPAPQRISLDILNESFARIHADGYFAVTTNTVQFGSHSDFFFGFSACSVSGSSGFDALIQFSPFHFIAEISSQFSVQVFGIGVYGVGIDVSLSGPTPWHVHGTASLSFFFFSIDIGIDVTWGDNPNTTLPPVQVMPILLGETQKVSNWKTALPANLKLLVVLRQLDPDEAKMVLHPAGTLQVSQRAIPLDLTIDKVGSQAPSDANQFALSVAGGALTKVRELTEQFAPSQFQNFDDATKLSQPAYVPHDSGLELAGSATLASATAITRPLRYDLTIIDAESAPRRFQFFGHSRVMFTNFLAGNSAGQSKLSANFRGMAQPQPGTVAVSNEGFAVALQSNNQAFHPEAAAFASQVAAQQYIQNAVAANPALQGTLHVIPQFEIAP